MKDVPTPEFKAKCLVLVEQVRKTKKPIRTTKFGEPVAEVVPASPCNDRAAWIGSMKGKMEILGDIVSPVIDESDIEVFAGLKLLLDTHIWVWTSHEPERIARRAMNETKSAENELWLSPVSTWETLWLQSKGRIRLPGDFAQWFAESTAALREAPLTHEIVMVAQRLPLHSDPS